jgi:glycosyltransferase involved in cell wall biosynthesis
MPRHAALAEIWGDAPVWVPTGEQTRVDGVFDGAQLDVDALSTILLDLVAHPEHARRAGQACQQRAQDPTLSWQEIGARWRTLVAEVRGFSRTRVS